MDVPAVHKPCTRKKKKLKRKSKSSPSAEVNSWVPKSHQSSTPEATLERFNSPVRKKLKPESYVPTRGNTTLSENSDLPFKNEEGAGNLNSTPTTGGKTFNLDSSNGKLQSPRTVQGDKDCRCTYCGKKFQSNYHCKRHMLTHTGEKPHVCSICHKGFGRREHLRRHLAKHPMGNLHPDIPTDMYSFQCKLCGIKTISKSLLQKHLFDDHRGVFEQPESIFDKDSDSNYKTGVVKSLQDIFCQTNTSKDNNCQGIIIPFTHTSPNNCNKNSSSIVCHIGGISTGDKRNSERHEWDLLSVKAWQMLTDSRVQHKVLTKVGLEVVQDMLNTECYAAVCDVSNQDLKGSNPDDPPSNIIHADEAEPKTPLSCFSTDIMTTNK